MYKQITQINKCWSRERTYGSTQHTNIGLQSTLTKIVNFDLENVKISSIVKGSSFNRKGMVVIFWLKKSLSDHDKKSFISRYSNSDVF